MKARYDKLSNKLKATIRTFLQTVIGGAVVMTLSLIGALTNLLSGDAVNLMEEISNMSRLFAIVVLGAVASFVAFLWNTYGTTANYNGYPAVDEDQ